MNLPNYQNFVTASIALILGACTLSSQAYGQETGPSAAQVQKFLKDSESRPDPIMLPAGMVTVVKKPSGEAMFFSDNGRYEFRGTIIDKWNEIEVKTYEDAEYSKNHIPVDSLSLNSDLLDPLMYGDGDRQKVVVFLSPNGKGSRAFLEDISDLKDEFVFEISVIPDDNTDRRTMVELSCAKDKEKALAALMNNSGYKELEPNPNCKLIELQNRMITFGILGFNAIPAVISPSSLISEGYREGGWDKFLKENMK